MKIGKKRSLRRIPLSPPNGDLSEPFSTNSTFRKNSRYFFVPATGRRLGLLIEHSSYSFKANHARYIRPDTVLHPLYFSCVRPELRRQGVVGNLLHNALEIASDHHFDTIVCESSSEQTTAACEQLGFKEVASVEYRSFLYEGENVFYPLPGMNEDYQKLAILERPIQSGLVV